ncbi:hypothetical protein PMAYCL1PPCAC_15250, partial [Pristionchus mayeri]
LKLKAALQGIFFFLELITYFILSPYARNKWEHFFLTTVSWCLVHGMDGFVLEFEKRYHGLFILHTLSSIDRSRQSNLTVLVFLRVIPSLNNSFGSLTLSQAASDFVHQAIFVFYFVPCLYLHDERLYALSENVGFVLIITYEICGLSHVCIAINRFVAVNAPFVYSRLFRYADFLKYVVFVITVALLDFFSILRVHSINKRHSNTGAQDAASAMRQRRERNLVFQTALQGIFFTSELITFFMLSPHARNKWEMFLLATMSWCLVHAMDGFIVLCCNRDFRQQIRKSI